jgi:hypothetical protein
MKMNLLGWGEIGLVGLEVTEGMRAPACEDGGFVVEGHGVLEVVRPLAELGIVIFEWWQGDLN